MIALTGQCPNTQPHLHCSLDFKYWKVFLSFHCTNKIVVKPEMGE